MIRTTALALVALSVGCSQAPSTQDTSIFLDPAGAAAVALERYDENGDKRLDEVELQKCPQLAMLLTAFDTDRDGKLSAEEIVGRLLRITMSSEALTQPAATCCSTGVRSPGHKSV